MSINQTHPGETSHGFYFCGGHSLCDRIILATWSLWNSSFCSTCKQGGKWVIPIGATLLPIAGEELLCVCWNGYSIVRKWTSSNPSTFFSLKDAWTCCTLSPPFFSATCTARVCVFVCVCMWCDMCGVCVCMWYVWCVSVGWQWQTFPLLSKQGRFLLDL